MVALDSSKQGRMDQAIVVARLLAAILLLGVSVVHAQVEAQQPTAPQSPVQLEVPEGYTWHPCELMKAQFLVPPGWHFLAAEQGGTAACFISKEEILPNDGFDTGITINQLKDIPGKRGIPPQQFAAEMAQHLSAAGGSREVLKEGTKKGTPFIATRLEVVDHLPDGVDVRIYYLWLSNPNTGTVYLVIFESPAEDWDANWALVEPVYQVLAFDEVQ